MFIVKNRGGGVRVWVDVDGGRVLLVVDGYCFLDIVFIFVWDEDIKNLELIIKLN